MYDYAILIVFSTSQELLNRSFLRSADAEDQKSALWPAALKQAP
jgi:hypothetical protein